MGEDVLQTVNLYLQDYHALAPSIRAEISNLRSALNFSRPHLHPPS